MNNSIAVSYEVTDRVAEIMLDLAPVNALTEEMVDAILDALGRAARDASVRAVILGSRLPDCFCAGLNLRALRGAPGERFRALLDKLYVRMTETQRNLGKPSIAAVGGSARGGGMTLAISCDLIVAGTASSFGYPEIELGLLPSIHFAHLHRIVGRNRAFDLLFTGRRFDAAEAHALGLVSRVVEPAQVLEEARSLARVLAAKSPTAMSMGRAAFYDFMDLDYRTGVAAAAENFCKIAATDQASEGIAAFVEKRRPSWKPD